MPLPSEYVTSRVHVQPEPVFRVHLHDIRRQVVPEISRFYGIVIAMYYRDHHPPHFHAAYGSCEAQVRIDPLGLLRGDLPPRALSMVVEWAALHRDELLDNWERLRRTQPLRKIEGL